jgi:hypothetical protein
MGLGAEAWREAARRSRDLAARLALLESTTGLHSAAVATLERGRALTLRQALGLDAAWLTSLSPEKRAPIEVAQRHLAELRESPPRPEEGSDPARLLRWEEAVIAAEATSETAQQAAGYQPLPSLDAGALAALAPTGGAVILLAAAEEDASAYILPAGCTRVEAKHFVSLPETSARAQREILIGWWEAYGPSGAARIWSHSLGPIGCWRRSWNSSGTR